MDGTHEKGGVWHVCVVYWHPPEGVSGTEKKLVVDGFLQGCVVGETPEEVGEREAGHVGAGEGEVGEFVGDVGVGYGRVSVQGLGDHFADEVFSGRMPTVAGEVVLEGGCAVLLVSVDTGICGGRAVVCTAWMRSSVQRKCCRRVGPWFLRILYTGVGRRFLTATEGTQLSMSAKYGVESSEVRALNSRPESVPVRARVRGEMNTIKLGLSEPHQ